jgi:protein-L-isoaspartate(D-aspartate) O-methyltransferase
MRFVDIFLGVACAYAASFINIKQPMSQFTERATSMTQLINYLEVSMSISELTRAAMLKVDRALFCDEMRIEEAYMDYPLPIGYGQTISAPHIHSFSLEHLGPRLTPGAKVLDVGSGSGYLGACFALMEPRARVYGIEVNRELVEQSKLNVAKLPGGAPPNLKLLHADGWKGLAAEGPFDAINVGAASPYIPPSLARSLKVGGTMLIPVGPQHGKQSLLRVTRKHGSPGKLAEPRGSAHSEPPINLQDFDIVDCMGVAFVPLIQPESLSKSD